MFHFLDFHNDKIVAVEVEGKLNHEDYAEHLIPKLEKAIETHGAARFFIDLKHFEGWELEAAWDDFKTGVKHRHDIEKIAIVGDATWEAWLSKIFALMMDGELRFYRHDQVDAAKAWIRS